MGNLTTGQDQAIRSARAQFRGSVNYRPQAALLDTIKELLGLEKSQPGVKTKHFTAQTSTAAAVVSGACRLYGLRIESGLAQNPAGDAALDVIVHLLDGTVIVDTLKCKADKAAEQYSYAGDDGVGIPISSSGLNVKAVAASDGSANPNAADRPNIIVYFGQ